MVEGSQKLGACLHTCASPEHPHGRVFTSAEYDRQAVRKAQKDAREKSRMATEKVGYPEKDTRYVTRVDSGQRHEFLAGHTRKRIVLEHAVSEHPRCYLNVDRSQEVRRHCDISMSC